MSDRAPYLTRPAVALDGAAIADLYLRAVRKTMPWLRLAHSDSEVKAWFSDELQRRHEVWVATTARDVSAFLALNFDRTWVDHLYVDPDWQGHGLGSGLLALAQSLSAGDLQLWAFERNLAARSFYEHRGFKAEEFGDGSTNQEREPDVRYRWQSDQPDHVSSS
ncbi:MAG: GNAT family N-acetyltransferase [Candidatus Dormiibacterota bacterium]